MQIIIFDFVSYRWLVRGEVLQRMLCNWNHLNSYFSTSVFNQICRYKARTLADMLFDDVNYLYICFLIPVVKEVDKINKFFQATNADLKEMPDSFICIMSH